MMKKESPSNRKKDWILITNQDNGLEFFFKMKSNNSILTLQLKKDNYKKKILNFFLFKRDGVAASKRWGRYLLLEFFFFFFLKEMELLLQRDGVDIICCFK